MKPTLTQKDFEQAARVLGCEVAAIKAVVEVECPLPGFHADGQPRILFEAHIFSKLTNGAYDATHPNISCRVWDQSLYLRGIKEHTRLGEACKLNRNAALQSASWGKFQIMGFNYASCGFTKLQDFINAMYRSELDHLMAFIKFVTSRGLVPALVAHDWARFAKGYNGASYAVNQYDTKLAEAYQRFKSGT